MPGIPAARPAFMMFSPFACLYELRVRIKVWSPQPETYWLFILN